MLKSTQKDTDLDKLSRDDLTYIVGLSRGHTDEQISQWVDREGHVSLDRLTPADIRMASRFLSLAARFLKVRQK